jgi:hypothetical protein
MYMQIELAEHPVAAAAETFPRIGAFYDAISYGPDFIPATGAADQPPQVS